MKTRVALFRGINVGGRGVLPMKELAALLESLRSGSERFVLRNGVLYLHAPDGIGRSRLAASAEKALGVPATARNLRTVCKVLDMARQYG